MAWRNEVPMICPAVLPVILLGAIGCPFRNNLTCMKKRIAFWTAFVSVASIATASTFHIPVRHLWSDADNAKKLGISVEEYRKLNKMGGQLSSDVRHGRPIRVDDVQYLFATAEKNDQLATHVMRSFYALRKTSYRSKAIEIAFKSSGSTDENEVYTAIDTLKHLGDPRWKGMAEAYPWKFQEYKEWILEPRRY